MASKDIYTKVSEHYSAASQATSSKYSSAVAKSFGYTDEELADAPEGSNLGLSCGNPLAMASIAEGEVVVDLGSGAGFDVFQAARKVGPSGKVIGVDMNKDMLAKANKIKSDTDATNVTFVEARITDMSHVIDSDKADCIISNCVVNLVPADEKPLVFREMFRLLRPGGRVAISDILARKPLPEKLKADMAMYVGCVAGASQVGEYEEYLKDAGFKDILVTDTKSDLNVYLDTNPDGSSKGQCCGGPKPEKTTGCCATSNEYISPTESDLNEWAGMWSFRIYAVKN
ncbi:putative arsenite methyltransferase-like protein [Hapsidospora chrysogenum ATCC 11550]|uniref:Arsenite methyltransferase n=1 Tax=Hapsidospora chrysogenum (strain ATCC 11550 / CBS 779.69 / DSM 880 / IAM 14645 / JCM 23072 / IMI 49137) TaxID=857340 RepID=A0A086TD52_HAPC1|nr:putative arsenite methyltransferase-like protein [Hapsidospora chrysogenum ATCC 11550]